jgi:serine protease
MHPAAVPNDPYWNSQWDLQDSATSQYGINLPTARDYFNGEPGTGVRVAIIDTGITVHSDLPTQPINWNQNGWDFFSDDSNPSDPGDACSTTRTTSSWHGTHVAGTIAAQTNNGKGVAGIAPATQLVIARALGPCGGSLTDVADAIRWSAGLPITNRLVNPPTLTNPAKVINLSLGGSSPTCLTYIQDAITAARAAGSLVVVAAGNSAVNASGFVPANCTGVVNVAAVGQTGKRAYYSNYGTSATIAAQGGDARVNAPNPSGQIYSTLNTGTTVPVAETYVPYQGTSMATPHVTGVAALLLSAKSNLTPDELTNLLTTSSTAFPADSSANSCQLVGCGAGILNASAALALLASTYTTQVDSVTALQLFPESQKPEKY